MSPHNLDRLKTIFIKNGCMQNFGRSTVKKIFLSMECHGVSMECSNTPNNCPTIITAFYIILNEFYENIKCRKFTVMGGLRG